MMQSVAFQPYFSHVGFSSRFETINTAETLNFGSFQPAGICGIYRDSQRE